VIPLLPKPPAMARQPLPVSLPVRSAAARGASCGRSGSVLFPPTGIAISDLKSSIPFAFGPELDFDRLKWFVSLVALPFSLIWIARYAPVSLR
jgi:hypothetical protein